MDEEGDSQMEEEKAYEDVLSLTLPLIGVDGDGG